MNIYLDIDGVLLANDIQPAKYVKEFLKYVTDNHTVYWLTTHCKGDSNYTVAFLSRLFDKETLDIAKKIKSTNWSTLKTDGIDFNTPFLWFDDDLFEAEREQLVKHEVLDNWIEVDLRKDVNQLQTFLTSFPIPIELVRKN